MSLWELTPSQDHPRQPVQKHHSLSAKNAMGFFKRNRAHRFLNHSCGIHACDVFSVSGAASSEPWLHSV